MINTSESLTEGKNLTLTFYPSKKIFCVTSKKRGLAVREFLLCNQKLVINMSESLAE